MFKKILIANRGEIACRVAATARRMAIQTVAVYSDADANAKHVSACDEAVHIGGSSPKDSYLRWERIIEAAKASGAQAIHPGYGFLSENEAFARACAEAGLVFIGPPPSAIQAMGLKAESKQLMEKAGVPLVPGYHGANQDTALLQGRSRTHRLSGADQGQRRRRRQGHAGGRQAGRLRVRAGFVQARGDHQLRRRRGADREIRAAAAPHRDPGVRRHAWQLRLPVRARLFGAAPAPEGAGGGAGAGHDRGHAPADGRRRGGGGARREVRRRRNGGVHRRAVSRAAR